MKVPTLTVRISKEGILFNALLVVFTFSFIFNLKFIGLEWMPAIRLVFIICTIFAGIKIAYFFSRDVKENIFFYLTQVFILIYVGIQSFLLPTDLGMLSKIIVFLVFTVYLAAAASFFFRDVEHFLRVIAACAVIQAILVYFSFLSPEYRQWLSGVMFNSGNIPFEDPFRVPGFSTGSGATLALALSIGTFSCMALYWMATSVRAKLLFLFSALFITFSCLFVGKIGLFLSAYSIMTFVVIGARDIKSTVFIFTVLLFFSFSIFLYIDIDFESIAYPLQRSFSIFIEGDDASLNALKEMPVPPIDASTIVGTGLAADQYGYNASGSDIGYIQTYYGFGLAFAVLFYVSFLSYLVIYIAKLRSKRNLILCLFFFAPLFIIEYKEPFISKVTYPFVLLVMLHLSRNEDKANGY
jgi:hypothetical protein